MMKKILDKDKFISDLDKMSKKRIIKLKDKEDNI